MELNWMDGFEIRVETDGKETCISVNRAGLLSLAGHLQSLAGSAVDFSRHVVFHAPRAKKD